MKHKMKFDLDIWTKNMYSLHKRVGIDDRGDLVYKRAESYLNHLNFSILDSHEIADEGDYEGQIVAHGQLPESNDLTIIKLIFFDDAQQDRSELDLIIYSSNSNILLPLLEQLKQVLWQ